MNLEIQDRLLILNILPSQGDIVKLRLVKELVSEVGLSEAEIKAWDVRTEANGKVLWDQAKAKPKDVKIGDLQKQMLGDILESLNKEGKLNLQQVKLYETFCKEKR